MGACHPSGARNYDAGTAPSDVDVRGGAAPRGPSVRLLPRQHTTGSILGVACGGPYLATAGEDGGCGLLDLTDGKAVSVWAAHVKSANRCCVGRSQTTLRVFTASRDTTLACWAPGRADPVARYEGHGLTVSALCVSADDRTLCSGSRDYSVRLWDAETAAQTQSAKVPRNLVTCLKWFGDGGDSGGSGGLIAQGSEDLRLRVWDPRGDLRSGPAQTFGGYTYFPLAVDASPSDGGRYLATGSKGFNSVGCEVRIWDRRNEAACLHLLEGHEQDCNGCVYLPPPAGAGGDAPPTVATCSKDETLRLWDARAGAALGRVDLDEHDGGAYTGLAAGTGGGGTRLVASTFRGGVYALGGRELRVVGAVPPDVGEDW